MLHWGADPGALADADLERLAADLVPAVATSSPDQPRPFPLLPGEADGWSGQPGLAGHRDGRLLHPRLVLVEAPALSTEDDGAQVLDCRAADVEAGLALDTELRLEASGLLRRAARA